MLFDYRRLRFRTPKTKIPKIIPTKIASHGKPGIAVAAPVAPIVMTVELRVVTEVAVVRDVVLIVDVIERAVLAVAVMVVFSVEMTVVVTWSG